MAGSEFANIANSRIERLLNSSANSPASSITSILYSLLNNMLDSSGFSITTVGGFPPQARKVGSWVVIGTSVFAFSIIWAFKPLISKIFSSLSTLSTNSSKTFSCFFISWSKPYFILLLLFKLAKNKSNLSCSNSGFNSSPLTDKFFALLFSVLICRTIPSYILKSLLKSALPITTSIFLLTLLKTAVRISSLSSSLSSPALIELYLALKPIDSGFVIAFSILLWTRFVINSNCSPSTL